MKKGVFVWSSINLIVYPVSFGNQLLLLNDDITDPPTMIVFCEAADGFSGKTKITQRSIYMKVGTLY